CGAVVAFVSVSGLLRLCLLSLALGTALLWLDRTSMLSFLGLAIIGLSLAPIFPSLIATTPERLGEAPTPAGLRRQLAAAALGRSLLPGLVGVLARRLGLEIVGPGLLTAALLLFVLYEALTAISPQHVLAGGPIGR